MLKVATHNLYQGGLKDFSAWARDLNSFNPDILLFQESYAPVRYLGKLSPEVQAQAHGSIWAEETWKTSTETKTNPWGSAIYLKQGASSELSFPADLRGWVVGAKLPDLVWPPAPSSSIYVFSIHTPTGTPRGREREVNAILDVIATLAVGRDVIIGGDFNITVSVRHGAEKRKNTEGEKAIHRRLQEEFGLINCWQALHPDQPLAQTFRRYFNDDPQPFHIDGIFVPSAWRPFLKSCEVSSDSTWRGEMNSDHFPMMATFTS